MVSGVFGQLLDELGDILHLQLSPDSNEACLIRLPQNLALQMEVDDIGENFVIAIDLGEIPAGRYREEVFKEALLFNGQPPPRIATFGYSSHTNTLVLFRHLPIKNLSGQKIADALAPFLELAILWKQAIKQGEYPSSTAQFRPSGKTLPELLGVR